MNRALRMKNPVAILLAIVLLLVAALPAVAAEAAKQVEVRVKVGSSSMSINGEKVKIQAPFNSGKIAMVPLSVFTNTKGFGATVKPANKNIQLTYLKHKLTITKNSKAATFDGKKATLPAAPVDKSGVTMVPVEAIAKALGIKLTTDSKTKELVLKGTGATPAATSGNSIDSDAGKSKIGDSYYTWSMNLPTNLAQNEQWDKGSKITFADVKGDYYMGVFVDEAIDPLDASDQRDLLIDKVGDEAILDKSAVTVDGNTFQRFVTKDKNSFYYEYRGIQSNDRFYTVIFGKKANDKSELSEYKSLLDSFKPIFDKSDKSTKDLSIVKNGKIAYSNANYGINIRLPLTWGELKTEVAPIFIGPENSTLVVKVNSIIPDDTIDAWIDRENQLIEEQIAPDYRKVIDKSEATWNGVPATIVKTAYTFDQKNWQEEVQLYAIKGKYKYAVRLSYPQTLRIKMTDVIYEMLVGMKIDFATVEKNFGEIPDDNDTADLTATITKTSKRYGYSITVPKSWVDPSVDMEEDVVEFNEGVIPLLIMANEGGTFSGFPEFVIQEIPKDGELKFDTRSTTTVGGVQAVKLEFSTTDTQPTKGKVIIYLFENKGTVYVLQASLGAAVETPLHTKQIDEAVASFKFN
jgi:Copper amine oxidase N-terminal domain.